MQYIQTPHLHVVREETSVHALSALLPIEALDVETLDPEDLGLVPLFGYSVTQKPTTFDREMAERQQERARSRQPPSFGEDPDFSVGGGVYSAGTRNNDAYTLDI